MGLPDAITDHPAEVVAALRTLALAAMTLLVAFGLKITPEQQAAILNFGAAATAIAFLFSVVTIKTTVPKTPSVDAPPSAIQQPPA